MPSSVEVIGDGGFRDSILLRLVIIRAGCRLRRNEEFQKLRSFLVDEDGNEDMKHSRHYIYLGIGGRKI
jgi:hypothetical protein